MPRQPYIVERCPVCWIEFKATAVVRLGSKTKEKRCPNGHWATLKTLKTYRKTSQPDPGKIAPDMVAVPAPPPLFPKMKEGESIQVAPDTVQPPPSTWRDYRAMVVVLVNAYDLLIDRLPARARFVVDGVFEKPVQLAKEMLGERHG